MAIVLKDRVKETTNTTGTGSFTLAGAVGGFQSFAAVGNGNITYYAAVDPATGAWEVGKGTYSTTGPTLTRDTVYESSAAGAKIDFGAGAKDVFVTYPAERAIFEEPDGNTLIDGGPLTVVGNGVTSYTSFSAVLAEMYGNVNSFAQMYAQNLNSGSEASADLVAYNDLGDGLTNFVDVGINSSNYSSASYPIFTPGSAYAFNDGGEMFVGSATDDVVIFAGGVDTTDEAVRIDKTTKNVTTVADVDVGGDVNATGGTFTSAVTTTASMASPATTEFVTREYVDNATSNGFHVHTPVLVATTGNLTATYNQPGGAGVGVGATLTNSGTQVALSIDGVSMATNDRILVWQQTTGLQNGIYVVTTVGSGSTNWVLTRAADANTSSEGDPGTLGGGDYFFVNSGDTLGYHSYICTNTAAIVFGTTAITFNEFSSVPEYIGGTNITVDGQTINVSGTIAATLGGTGVNTVATGDLLYGSGTNTWGKLAAGAAYKSLVMNAGGTNVEWNAVALDQSGSVSGALPATNGGTGQTSYATGDILYSNTANALAKLSGNTTTTKKFLGQTGTGTASQAPVWEQPAASDITGLAPSATTDTTNAANITSGTLPAARLNGSYTGITGVGTLTAGTWNASTIAANRGGTGLTSYTVGDLLYADTTTTLAALADVATGNALISGGVAANPSWGKIGLATHVSGTLPIANGGTNATATPTAGAVAFGTGTAYAFNSAGTSGQLLTSAGTGTPTWTSQSSLSVGTATNLAGGAANQVPYQTGSGATAFTSAPSSAGQALTWNGSAFTWATAGSATLQDDTTTNATYYPTFATATSGSFTDARVSSTKFTFNPNTGTLSATVFSGSLVGTTATAVRSSYQAAFNTTTPGGATYGIHFNGQTTADFASGITWNGGSTTTTNAQAGIYVQGSGVYGSRMYIATTDSYATGARTAISISETGLTNFVRARPTALGNVILDAGNYNSYALPLSGGTMTGTITNSATSLVIGNAGGVQRGYLYNDSSGFGLLTNSGSWAVRVDYGTNNTSFAGAIKRQSAGAGYLNGDYGTIESVSTTGAIYSIGGIYVPTSTSYSTMYGVAYAYSGSGRPIGNAVGIPSDNWTFVGLENGAVKWGLSTSNGTGYFSGGLRGVGLFDNGSRVLSQQGASYYQVDTWLQLNGFFGLYAPTGNGAHFYPNNASSYTTWAITGSRNSYGGIFDAYSGVAGFMYDSGGNGGAYREAGGGWYFYYNRGNACMGIGTSATSSSYGIYVIKGVYSEGNVVAYSDERVKTNWRDYQVDFVERLAEVKHGTYDRTDLSLTQDGVSAQSLRNLLPYSSPEDEHGKLSVNYGGAALVSAIQLAKRVVEQDKRIAELEALVAKLVK